MNNKSTKFSLFTIIFLISFLAISKFNIAHAGLIEDIIKKEKLDPENKEGDQCKLMEKVLGFVEIDYKKKLKEQKLLWDSKMQDYNKEFYYRNFLLCHPNEYSQEDGCNLESYQSFYILYSYDSKKNSLGISPLQNIYDVSTNNQGYLVSKLYHDPAIIKYAGYPGMSELDYKGEQYSLYYSKILNKKNSYIYFKKCKIINYN